MSIYISQFFTEVLVPSGDVPPPPTSPPPVSTGRFDAGERNYWYVVPQISDSGDELRDKVVKAFHATGKMTAPYFSIYGYGPAENIDVEAVENGTDSKSGKKALPSTTQVQRTARRQINVPNVDLHTCRLEGTWDGSDGNMKDQVHEICYEVARQGIRR